MKRIIKKIIRIIILAEVITFTYINKALAVVTSSSSINYTADYMNIKELSQSSETAYGAVSVEPMIRMALIKVATFLLIWIAIPSIIAIIISKHKDMNPKTKKVLKIIMYLAIFTPFIFIIISLMN